MTTSIVITTPNYPITVKVESEVRVGETWTAEEPVTLGSGATYSMVIHDSKRITSIHEVWDAPGKPGA